MCASKLNNLDNDGFVVTTPAQFQTQYFFIVLFSIIVTNKVVRYNCIAKINIHCILLGDLSFTHRSYVAIERKIRKESSRDVYRHLRMVTWTD